jgi:hypothetical protein
MPKLLQALHLLKDILWRPWVVIVLALYGLLQLVSNVITWTLPTKDQERYQFIQLVNWRVWIVITPILTIVLLVLILHAAYKVIVKRDADNSTEVEALKGKIAGLEARNKYNLIFDVDTKRKSFVHVLRNLGDISRGSNRVPKPISCIVELHLRLRFENHDVNPIAIKKMDVAIISKENGVENNISLLQPTDIQISQEGTDEKIKLDEVEILGGRFTPYYWLKCKLELPAEYIERLNENNFLRVILDAMRQPPYIVDFNLNWYVAGFDKSYIKYRN